MQRGVTRYIEEGKTYNDEVQRGVTRYNEVYEIQRGIKRL